MFFWPEMKAELVPATPGPTLAQPRPGTSGTPRRLQKLKWGPLAVIASGCAQAQPENDQKSEKYKSRK